MKIAIMLNHILLKLKVKNNEPVTGLPLGSVTEITDWVTGFPFTSIINKLIIIYVNIFDLF